MSAGHFKYIFGDRVENIEGQSSINNQYTEMLEIFNYSDLEKVT